MESSEKRRTASLAALTFVLGGVVGFALCWSWFWLFPEIGVVDVGPINGNQNPGGQITFTAAPARRAGTVTRYRGRDGESFLFNVTGEARGSAIWGTDIYTDDSPVPIAAVHFGALGVGETGIIRVTILPGQNSYSGTARNGVTSQDYEKWEGSYRLERVNGPATAPVLDLPGE